jgi:hypothetical protein
MPSEPFLHERSDLKALVETVADSEKINDPALVLLVQHSGWVQSFPRALGSA